MLVACHGAGLTNMIFAPSDAHVVEVSFRGTDSWKLRGMRYHKADFHNMAHVLNKGYTEVPCRSVEGTYGQEYPEIGVERVYVSAHKVIGAVRAALATPGPPPPPPPGTVVCSIAYWQDHQRRCEL